jgi:hypothetical protein
VTHGGTDRHRKPATIVNERLTGWEQLWWVLWNIFTIGMPYTAKILLKKAVAEAIVLTDQARYQGPGFDSAALPRPGGPDSELHRENRREVKAAADQLDMPETWYR